MRYYQRKVILEPEVSLMLNDDPVDEDRLQVAFGSDQSIETVRFDRF